MFWIVLLIGIVFYAVIEGRGKAAADAQYDHAAENPLTAEGAASVGRGCAIDVMVGIVLALVVAATVLGAAVTSMAKIEQYQVEHGYTQSR